MTQCKKIRLISLVVCLFHSQLRAQDTTKIEPAKDKPFVNSIGMKLKLLPASTFVMGLDADLSLSNANPAHKVTAVLDRRL